MEKLNFKQTLELLKSKVTLKEVIESYGIPVLNPNKFISCPFHGRDSTPSLKLYDADSYNGSAHCFGCKKTWDAVSFCAEKEGVSNGEALSRLCSKYGIASVSYTTTNGLLDSLSSILKPKPRKPSERFVEMEAGLKAYEVFHDLKTANLTKYLIDKQVQHVGTKNKGTTLCIPVLDEFGKFWNIQYISANGKKWYEGGRLKGCMFRLGPEDKSFSWICEGYATAASVYMATGKTTYVAFSAGNYGNVFKALKSIYPEIKLILAGDNDKIGRSIGLPSILPPKEGFDWNDVWVSEGPEKTKQLLMGGLNGVR